jgi:hypothetical protein
VVSSPRRTWNRWVPHSAKSRGETWEEIFPPG